MIRYNSTAAAGIEAYINGSFATRFESTKHSLGALATITVLSPFFQLLAVVAPSRRAVDVLPEERLIKR